MPRVKRSIARFVLVPAAGGCFEVTVGGRLLYSKLATGRFPDEDALLAEIEKAVGV